MSDHLAGALLGSTPAHTVGEAADVSDLLDLDPLYLGSILGMVETDVENN